MARYTGPKSKISRRYAEPIFGDTKVLEKKPYPPGQHGRGRRKKPSEYAIQLSEKQIIISNYTELILSLHAKKHGKICRSLQSIERVRPTLPFQFQASSLANR